MSILIKGMRMPDKKNGAVIILYPDGSVALENGKEYKAIELPPHGRLIDADALGITPIDITDLPYRECLMVYLAEDVKDAPTIIEPEGEE